jgi:hypothetical protein
MKQYGWASVAAAVLAIFGVGSLVLAFYSGDWRWLGGFVIVFIIFMAG